MAGKRLVDFHASIKVPKGESTLALLKYPIWRLSQALTETEKSLRCNAPFRLTSQPFVLRPKTAKEHVKLAGPGPLPRR